MPANFSRRWAIARNVAFSRVIASLQRVSDFRIIRDIPFDFARLTPQTSGGFFLNNGLLQCLEFPSGGTAHVDPVENLRAPPVDFSANPNRCRCLRRRRPSSPGLGRTINDAAANSVSANQLRAVFW
jgi:hypothetical protein